MMKIKIILFLILILAASLRLYRLADNPPSVYGDEQAFAWNAWNILKTGQDEYGNFLPLQFKSFDDYKAPVPVYLLVPFIKVLGLNAWSVRLPVALSGVAAVLVTFYLIRLFLSIRLALLVSFLMAISSWHIHLSRGFFEANLALTFFLAAVYFFFKAKEKASFLIISSLFFVLTLYTYFIPRILIPLFLLFLIFYNRNWILKQKRNLVIFFLILFVLCLPLVKMAIFERGNSRLQKLLSLQNEKIAQAVNLERRGSLAPNQFRLLMHNKVIVWFREVKNNYLEHFSLNFWYLYGDNSLRYFLGNMGMFYLFELPFLIWGIFSLWKEKRKVAIFFLGWILLAPLPTSLVGRSFALRSLTMLPAPFVFVAAGLDQFWQKMGQLGLKRLAFLILFFGFLTSLGSYLLRYYLDYPAYAATWWGFENKAAIACAKKYENDFEKIFISDYYTGTTLALAFYEKLDPRVYQQALAQPLVFSGHQFIKFGKFYIGSFALDKPEFKEKIPENSLYLAGPMEMNGQAVITSPADNHDLFKIHVIPDKNSGKMKSVGC